MRISDWSSDVCSSDLVDAMHRAVLRPGQRLPSSRQLAERIGVSRNTVSLAYDALLADGYLSSRSRSGVYVAADVAGTRIGASRRRRDPESPLAARLAPEDRKSTRLNSSD